MKTPRVKHIIQSYKTGNIISVYKYLTQENMIVDSNTWAGQVKQLIENGQFYTAKQIIELIAYKLTNI